MAGRRDVKGITNFLKKAEGDDIGVINFSNGPPTDKGWDKETEAIQQIAAAVPNLDRDNEATSAELKVRGVTNFIDDVKGKAIGGINFGRRDDSKKEGREDESVPIEKK